LNIIDQNIHSSSTGNNSHNNTDALRTDKLLATHSMIKKDN